MPPQGSPPDLQVGVRCRFCGDAAVVGVRLGRGCVCYPDERYQDLCHHHLLRATPLGDMDVVVDFTAERAFLPAPGRPGPGPEALKLSPEEIDQFPIIMDGSSAPNARALKLSL